MFLRRLLLGSTFLLGSMAPTMPSPAGAAVPLPAVPLPAGLAAGRAAGPVRRPPGPPLAAMASRDTRVGVGLAPLVPGGGAGIVFVDAMKQAAPWQSLRPLALDGDGNVAALAPGQSAETVVFRGDAYPAGDYLLLYDGRGRIELDPRSGTVVAAVRGRATVRVSPNPDGIRLRLTATDPRDHLRNVRLILPGFERTYATQPFHPLFLRAVAPFGVLRLAGWMDPGGWAAGGWERRTTRHGATQAGPAGVAAEYLVALANATGAEPWFVLPAGADDTYVARFAGLVAGQLDPRLTPVFEYGDAVWRPAASGLDLSGYATRSARVAALVRQAFGAAGRRAIIVVSGPLAVPGTGGEALDRAILAATAGVADAFAVPASNLNPAEFAAGVAASARLAGAARLPLIAYQTDLLGVAQRAPGPQSAAALGLARSPAASRLYADVLEAWHGAGGGLIVTEPVVQAAYAAPAGGLLERVDQNPLSAAKYVGVLTYMARHPMPHVVPAPPRPALAAAAPAHPAATPAPRPRPAQPAAKRRRRAVTAANSYARAILADGPIALYQLNDTGTVAADSGPSGFNGTVGASVGESAPGLLACCGDPAMTTPGTATTAGTIMVPPNAAFQLNGAVSLETLLRFAAAPAVYSVPVGYGSDYNYAPYDLYFTGNGVLNAQFFLTSGVLVATAPSPLLPNRAYHVVSTFDGATARLYVDGSQVASAALAGTLSGYDAQHGLAIGDDAALSDPGFAGTLSDVAVYGKTLSPAQVQAHYQASRTVATPAPTPTPVPTPTPGPPSTWTSSAYVNAVLASGPAAYYRSNDAGTVAADSSPNRRNGTIGAAVTHAAPSLVRTTTDPGLSYPGTADPSGATVFPPNPLLTPATKLSFECFLQFATVPAAYAVPLSYGTDYDYAPYDLYFTGNGVLNAQFTLTSGVLVVTAPAPLRANTPYHVAATFDGATGRLYLNGVQVATAALSGTLTAYDANHGLAIGDDAGFSDPGFAGTVEQVAIYTKTLAAKEIANHYAASLPVDWLTFHGDALRSGWNAHERDLTVANVGSANFGLRATLAVDGQVYAQPLVAANEPLPGGGNRNLLIVASENDSVYAFDADSGAPIWQRSFSGPGVTPVPWNDSLCNNVAPTVGITGTPVIDRARDTVYVAAATDETSGGTTLSHVRLHALSLQTGADRTAPADIGGSVPQSGGGTIPFVPQWQMNRASLLEANGGIYVAFGSHCDYGGQSAHGWLFAYDAATLAPAGGIFNSTTDPTTSQLTLGGIWGSGFGPAADAAGNVYAATGNGTYYDGARNLSQSVLKLRPGLPSAPVSTFTTNNQAAENDGDLDLGSAGVLLLPDQPGATPRLAVAGGKTGITYVLNRDALGGYVPGGPDAVVYEAQTNGGSFGGPAYFVGADGNPYLIISGGNDPVQRFRLQLAPAIALVAAGQAPAPIGSVEGGSMPIVSSNGTQPGTAIVWALSRPADTTTPIVLNAYDGANLAHQLFQGPAHPWTNANGNPFVIPTVANGKVYVPTGSTVDIFGLK